MSHGEQKPYISDPKLIPRIKSFLSSKSADSTILPESVVQHLQATYSDYSRKKKNAFAHSVSKALPLARSEVFGPEAHLAGTKRHRPNSSSDSDPECLVAYENTNSINIAMRNLYKSGTAARNTGSPQTPEQSQKSKKKKKSHQTPLPNGEREVQSPASPSHWVIDRSGANRKGSERAADSGLDPSSEPDAAPQEFTDKSVDSILQKTRDAAYTHRCACGAKEKTRVKDSGESSGERSSAEGSSRAHKTKTSDRGALNRTSVAPEGDGMEGVDEKSGDLTKKEKLKRKKAKSPYPETGLSDVESVYPTKTFRDFGGNHKLLKELYCELKKFFWSDLRQHIVGRRTRGYLLYGPQGSGKKFLAECIAGHLEVPLLKPRVNMMVSGVSGGSEQRIRDLFEQAASQAPCVLFLEDIECLAPRQEAPGTSKDMMSRMVSELGSCIDELHTRPENVVLIAATSKIDSVHEALRIPGRFVEKTLGIPDEKARLSILQKMCVNCTIAPDYDLKTLARHTPGFVGGDLHQLVADVLDMGFDRLCAAYMTAENPDDEFPPVSKPPDRLSGKEISLVEQDQKAVVLTKEDFMVALKKAQPAALREGFATVPTTTWADIGALQHVQAEMEKAILRQIQDPELTTKLNKPTCSGVMLYGPPGCGKTKVAKAMANEAGLNFMSVKGPELLDKYVGETERKLRQILDKAQMCAPCLIFFDEVDALCSNRQSSEGSNVTRSFTSQMLPLLDGCGERNQVYVMGATNIIENIDPALLRPGRFGKQIYIGLPDVDGRLDILRKLTQRDGEPRFESCDLQYFAQQTEGFSGADLENLVSQAKDFTFEEIAKDARWKEDPDKYDCVVTGEHMRLALPLVKPSVKKKDVEKYRRVVLQCEPK